MRAVERNLERPGGVADRLLRDDRDDIIDRVKARLVPVRLRALAGKEDFVKWRVVVTIGSSKCSFNSRGSSG